MPRVPAIHFRLKAPDKKGLSNIYLQFIYNKRRLYYSFGQSVKQLDWNDKKERVKNKLATTNDGKYSLNDLLDNLENICKKTYQESLKDGIPEPATLKNVMEAFLNKHHKEPKEITGNPTLYSLAQRFVNGEIKNKGKDKSRGSLNNYAAVLKHIKAFENDTNTKVDFETIDLNFFYSYVNYLKTKKNLAVNTIAKDISILKVFMSEAVDLEYTDNMKFKHRKFSYNEEETEHVYLTAKDLDKLYRANISNKKLAQVRDLFIFGAWVGLRFSDFSNIKSENIIEMDGDLYIKIVTQKTKELVIIPCNPVVIEIFEKYKDNENRLPNTISNQKFNDYIKEAARIAELNEFGRLGSKPKVPLHKLISSHTARRSFATNYYLQGFPSIDLMKVTGHKSERSFLKYIRVSKLDTAKRLNNHIKQQIKWQSKSI